MRDLAKTRSYLRLSECLLVVVVVDRLYDEVIMSRDKETAMTVKEKRSDGGRGMEWTVEEGCC